VDFAVAGLEAVVDQMLATVVLPTRTEAIVVKTTDTTSICPGIVRQHAMSVTTAQVLVSLPELHAQTKIPVVQAGQGGTVPTGTGEPGCDRTAPDHAEPAKKKICHHPYHMTNDVRHVGAQNTGIIALQH